MAGMMTDSPGGTPGSNYSYTPPATNKPGVDPTAPANSTPYNSAIPGADIYAGADANAIKAYNDALTSINYNRQQLLSQNGYAGDVDPATGSISNLRVDPYNPYGGLQQMLNSQARQDMSAADDASGRGFTGGLAHQPEAALRYEHGAQSADFGRQLFAGMQGYNSQQASAADTRANALWQSQLQQAMLAMQNGNFNQADYTTNNDGSGGGKDSPPPPTDYTTGRNRNGSVGPNNRGLTSAAVNNYGTPRARKAAPKPQVSAIPHDMRPKKKGG